MLDYFRGVKPWRQLLQIVHNLPADSHFQSALAMDEDRAQRLLELYGDADDAPKPKPVAPLGYTLEAMLLLRVIDMLKVVSASIAALGGGKPKHIEPEPRPTTAFELAKARRDRVEVDDALARMGVLRRT